MAFKGRGATRDLPNRYAPLHSEAAPPEDDWERQPASAPHTDVRVERASRIIAWNRSPDVPFDRSLNPYRGCEHGCIYCYARPSHAYLDLSPGLDFETRLVAKTNAAEALRSELAKPGYRCAPITLGANTDPYQPIEQQYRLSRQLLEVLLAHHHPCTIITKSQGVLDDLPLLREMAARQLVQVMVSVTTLNDDLKRTLEPRTASGRARLRAIARLAEAGIPVGVMVAPVIPVLNDCELEKILGAAHQAGARQAGYVLVRLPLEVAPLFEEWLATHYPGKAAHVMSIIHQSRGGHSNDPRFGSRMRGEGVFAELLAQRFRRRCRELGLDGQRTALDVSRFRVPGQAEQMNLFS